MSSAAIRELFITLEKETLGQSRAEGLTDKVLSHYNAWVVNKLKPLLNQQLVDESPLLEELSSFLQENWQVVKGTYLAPTAIPHAQVTELLCAIAVFIAEQKNSVLANKEEQLTPLHLMMPSISLESITDEFPSFDTSSNLKTVLKTHILSQDCSVLLPIALLTTMPLNQVRPLPNPYYDYAEHKAQNAFLTKEEYQRLANHSLLCDALAETKKSYDRLSSDNNHLLGQLLQLNEQLSLYGVSGLGQEENAGGGAYPALIKFMDYYALLNDAAKARIPNGLREEIDLLLALCTDDKVNIKATTQLETCIGTRRATLMHEMIGHEALLATITISGSQKASLIAEVQGQFAHNQQHLSQTLDADTYNEGYDKLSLTRSLLNTLGVEFKVTTEADLATVKALNALEMSHFLQEEALRRELIEKIGGVDNLIIFIQDLSPEKMTVFMHAMHESIAAQCLHTVDDLAVLLINLKPEFLQIMCPLIQQQMTEFITLKNHFDGIANDMTTEQFLILFKFMQEQPTKLIATFDDFLSISQGLNAERYNLVLEQMHEELPKLLANFDDFSLPLWALTAENKACYLEHMQEYLPQLILSTDNLVETVQHTSSEQHPLLLEQLTEQLPQLIPSNKDLIKVLTLLNAESQEMLLQLMERELPDYVNSITDFNELMACIALETDEFIPALLLKKLVLLVKDAADFETIVRNLSPLKTVQFCEQQGEHLQHFIQSIDDPNFKIFSPEQAAMLEQWFAAQASLALLVDTNQSAANKAFFKRIIEEQVPQDPGLDDFIRLLAATRPSNRLYFCELMQEPLASCIQSASDLDMVLGYLTSGESLIVVQQMKKNWHTIMQSPEDVDLIKTHIAAGLNAQLLALADESPDHAMLFKAYKERLNSIQEGINTMAKILDAETSNPSASVHIEINVIK